MKTSFLGVVGLFLGVTACLAAEGATAPTTHLPAFPGAEGFGALATGGRGGSVYHVTNLGDSGAGSFRDAVSQPKRTVVFDVGGVIKIASKVAVSSDITLAGETAPGEGITIYGEGVSFSGSRNIIVRHLRFRQGIKGSRGGKSVNVSKGSDMIFDHISAQWGRWDSMGVTQNSARITFQNSIIGEAIAPQRFGALFDSVTGITLARNLWINNQSRNPKLKGDIQYINNVVYNWGSSGVVGGHSAAVWHEDLVNNLLIKGPSSNDSLLAMWDATDHVFQRGNMVDLTADGKLNARPIIESDFHGDKPPTFQNAPFNAPPVAVTVLSIEKTWETVLAGAGASLHRDAVDQRLIKQAQSLGTQGAIVQSEDEAGGLPQGAPVFRPANFDTDRDGMPDEWERHQKLNPQDAGDGPVDEDKDGYTNVEEYLNNTNPNQYIDYREPRHNFDAFSVRAHITHANIEYGKAGDENLLLDASVPAGNGPFPVALLVHGGGWGSGDKQGDISTLGKPLSDANFTWFSINYRLAPKNRWPAALEDVQAAIRWVKAHSAEYKGDPQRIALIGYSAGGQLITLATVLAQDDTRVQAVVGISPPTDLVADTERRGELSLALRNLLGRATVTDEARRELHDLSPLNYVKPGLPPFLLIHGTADKSVPYAQSLNFQKRLAAGGVPCDLVTIQDAPHAIADWEKNNADYKAKLVAWLQRTLGAKRQ